MSEWGKYIVGNSNTLLEKSPPNITKNMVVKTFFPKSKFIILTRKSCRNVIGDTKMV